MKKDFLKYSFWLSAVSIASTLIINFKISQDYFRSSGKDRAFFAVHAALNYLYQYYIAIFGLIALVLIFLSWDKKNLKGRQLIAVGLAVFAIIFVFAKLWRLFVLMEE